MLIDALRWNMLNIIRVELFFNCYRIWNVFVTSSLQSSRGQYAIVSLLITLVAQFAVQFNLSWLLTIYTFYLAGGMCVWVHRRVYFYHRKLDSLTVSQFIQHNGDSSSRAATMLQSASSGGTLRPDKHSKDHGGAISPGGLSSSSEHTNSLQRQRAMVYRDFQNVLVEPRRNHREFAMSLAHLSHIAKLFADKDVFDEMHFQVLATRRDVVNLILRTVLLAATTVLAYF